ncbi:OmpA family protein [Tamlana sp. 2201CG12-4]|uniref:OmpA family protein n=1 Tax=Tamlana sp. 2201CG12-4 TaxID=3112582 RepID=UPI002DB9E107|nr:OmpA family protein [Tamlana sp. 2201CG12-4]MEC3908673.1 OmpA family protein [Tamlana sp. 2201CG12-4]
MKLKNYIIACFSLLISITIYSQNGRQKRADNLFNKFAFVNAAEAYQELIDKDYNTDYAIRQLADSYAYMRNPDSAVVYYKQAVQQGNVPVEYYYNYAQALRGIKDYAASRKWMKRFKDAGGKIENSKIQKDSDFITSIFNAKQQYFLKDIKFNSKYSDFGAYEYNGSIYFASSRDEGVSTRHRYGWNGEPFLDIYVTDKNTNDSIVDHKSKLKGDVNSIYHEGPISISKDGKTMYFSRTGFIKNTLSRNNDGISTLKIYKALLIGDKWTNIEELPFNSNEFSNGHPALNEDGSKLYFSSDMPGGLGGTDIYYVDIKSDGAYGKPKNLGAIVNTNKNERFPFINSEGVLFFSSDGHPGLGLLDIFGTVSDKNNNLISVLNLGVPINSSKDDFSFFMNADGLSGYFASNRDGGVGSDDIYGFDRIPQLKIEGTVYDGTANTPIPHAIVSIMDPAGKEIARLKTDKDGVYDINIDRDTDYHISVKKDDYIDNYKTVTSKGIERSITSITTDFSMNPVPPVVEEITDLGPIHFEFDSSNIRNEDTTELDRIVDLMQNTYPDMTIKIESHSDSRGPAAYNKILSNQRATATYNYLISKGVNADRIIEYKGYGEEQLVNGCNGTMNCTEEQHQLNRRTNFVVIKVK